MTVLALAVDLPEEWLELERPDSVDSWSSQLRDRYAGISDETVAALRSLRSMWPTLADGRWVIASGGAAPVPTTWALCRGFVRASGSLTHRDDPSVVHAELFEAPDGAPVSALIETVVLPVDPTDGASGGRPLQRFTGARRLAGERSFVLEAVCPDVAAATGLWEVCVDVLDRVRVGGQDD